MNNLKDFATIYFPIKPYKKSFDGQVIVRPMMYIALSYDHRVIDGKDSVSFLLRIKQLFENPINILFRDSSGEKTLLDLYVYFYFNNPVIGSLRIRDRLLI